MMKITIASVLSLILGVGTTAVYFRNYQEIHNTNIGGVVIDGKRVFELVELSDPAQGVVHK